MVERTGTANPLAGVDLGIFSISAPSLADLDGDGDLDAVVGEVGGVLNYFRNNGTATAPDFADQTGVVNPFAGVGVGSSSAPSFADLDGDGDLDAVVGRPDGNLNYFRNNGTAAAARLRRPTGVVDPFAGVEWRTDSTPRSPTSTATATSTRWWGKPTASSTIPNNGTATAPDFADQTGVVNPFAGFDVGTTAR